MHPCRYFASRWGGSRLSVFLICIKKPSLPSAPVEVCMFPLKVIWQLPTASGPSLSKLQPPCSVLGLPQQPHSCSVQGAPGTFPLLRYDTITLKKLYMLMNKKAGGKKNTLYSKKGRAQCYFIHLWDFIIKFNAIIHLAFSKDILVFSLKILPWQSLRILHICLGFPDVLQPDPYYNAGLPEMPLTPSVPLQITFIMHPLKTCWLDMWDLCTLNPTHPESPRRKYRK